MNAFEKVYAKAKRDVRTVVLAESGEERTLKAIEIVQRENYANIVLIGNKDAVSRKASECGANIDMSRIEVVDPASYPRMEELINDFYEMRKAKGMTVEEARRLLMEGGAYLGMMLVYKGIGEGFVSGAVHRSSADTIKPALQIIKTAPGISKVSSFFMMSLPDGRDFIFSDCGLQINPTAEDLAEIAYLSAQSARLFDIEPRVAMLSFSTKGSGADPSVDKMKAATELARQKYPELVIDGELQLDAAIVPGVAAQKAPGSPVGGNATVLIFPDLDAGNIGYKLTQRFGNAKAIGPVLQGLKKPISDLSRGCTAQDIADAVCIVSVQIQQNIHPGQ